MNIYGKSSNIPVTLLNQSTLGILPGEATLPFHFCFPFSRESTLKMKEFLLGVDLLLKRHHYPVKETGNPKVVPFRKY